MNNPIQASPTLLSAGVRLIGAGTMYVSGMVAVLCDDADYVPAEWIPDPIDYDTLSIFLPGTPSVEDEKFVWAPAMPVIVKDVQVVARTAGNITFDIEQGDGSSWNSIFLAPKSLSSARYASFQPDGTYRYRCIDGLRGSTNHLLRLNVDASATIEDVMFLVRIVQPRKIFKDLIDYRAYGETG